MPRPNWVPPTVGWHGMNFKAPHVCAQARARAHVCARARRRAREQQKHNTYNETQRAMRDNQRPAPNATRNAQCSAQNTQRAAQR
eukprot:14423290-Alexandrium_andersonii.AAC.1